MRNKSTRVAACHCRGRLPNVHFSDVATGAFNMVTEQRAAVHPDLPPVGLMDGLEWGEVSQPPVVLGSPIISWAAAQGPVEIGMGHLNPSLSWLISPSDLALGMCSVTPG